MKVTKWSTPSENCNVSEPQTDQTNAVETGPVDASGESASGAIESPKLAPAQDVEAKPDAAKPDADKSGAAKSGAAKLDETKTDMPKAELTDVPGRMMIMSPARGDDWHSKSWQDKSWQDSSRHGRSWDEAANEPEADAVASGILGKRRMSALAAIVALAAMTGAVGGALATAGLGHLVGGDSSRAAIVQARALEESIMRIDADVAALKISAERAGRQNVSQFSKTSDRLDRIEKAQAEPAAKLAKLSDAVEKLRVAPAPPTPPTPPAAPVASAPAKEITGSVSTPPAAPVPMPAPKPEIARLPTLEGWVLLDVANGGATIEGRNGMFEVYAGDPVPGLGRIDAVRKQDGRWVVVTTKGLIVAR